MSARAERSIVPRLEGDERPDSREDFEAEVKDLLEGDVEERTVDDSDFVYEFSEEDDDGAAYELVNADEFELDNLPGLDSVENDFSVMTDSYHGIDRVGVDQDGSVTLESNDGNELTYFLAGVYQGQAAIKDGNGIIWMYDTVEDELQYRNSSDTDGWVDVDPARHKAKFDKVVDFQQQLWALNRAADQVEDWNYSEADKGKRDVLKSRFDKVMREITLNNKDNKYEASKEKNVTSGGAKGKDVVADFKKARDRFRAYGLLKYGIDPVDEIDVAESGSEVVYRPEDF
ncbi:hypothetical protein GKQ38_01925 [Candidatus Nanohaloarchaea archaeon]|nr:hypothetical protein GKQ38_01925 [Candidatus Nanohaloarchaea archaeon]